MLSETSDISGESLGDHLRNARTSKGLNFAEIAKDTKISIGNLTAMEENNYDSLPAEVFTRGFYSLYAVALSLDPTIVLKKYDCEKTFSKQNNNNLLSSCSLRREYGSMAERPHSMPFSYIGVITFLLLLFGAFLCFYFSWNPATYLSLKIRKGQDSVQQEHILKSPEKEFFELQNMLSITSTSNASEIKRQLNFPVIPTDNYIVKANFKETTKVTLVIDDKPVYDSTYKKGDSAAWSAKNKINITLPGKTTTLLSLNESQIHLPKTENATLTISIPKDLQQ